MTEFIKKIDLLNAMARIQPSSEDYSSDIAYWAARDMFDDILFQINAVTDAETEYIPMVHGHWIYLGGGLAKCSVCKWVVKDSYDQDNDDLFCRKCGSKMDESEDNTNV